MRRDMWPAWLILILSLLITVGAWRFETANIDRDARQRFDAQTSELVDRIRGVVASHEQTLRGSVALFASVDRVSRTRWRLYVRQAAAEGHYYRTATIGFAEFISAPEKAKLERRIRKEGLSDYTIVPDGDRDQYVPIVYLEPLDSQNQNSLGFDLFSETTRRAALEYARDTGEATLSGKVELATETGFEHHIGVLLFMPVYRNGRSVKSVEERRSALEGFVFKPIVIVDLIGSAIGYPGAEKATGIRFEIVDNREPRGEAELYATGSSERNDPDHPAAPRFAATASLPLLNTNWQIRFSSTRQFEQAIDQRSPIIVLLIGGLFSGLLSAIAWTSRMRHIEVADAKERIEAELAERRRAELASRQNEMRLRLAFAAGRMGSWRYEVETHATSWSPELRELVFGGIEVRAPDAAATATPQDSTLESIVHSEDRERYKRNLADQLSDPQNEVYQDEFRTVRPDGSCRWLELRGQIRRERDGRAREILAIATDITERKQAEERERLLSGELRHRGKNLLAVVQSIASQSLAARRALPDAREDFLRRLQALARTDTILTDASWTGASLAEIVRLEMEAFTDRTSIEGPLVVLQPAIAQTFALLIHELATNALKYGALSVPTGKVTLRWEKTGPSHDARLKFRWQEQDGPPVTPPTDAGFGSTLLMGAFNQGSTRPATIEFARDGLIYELEVMLDEVTARRAIDPSAELTARYFAQSGNRPSKNEAIATPVFRNRLLATTN